MVEPYADCTRTVARFAFESTRGFNKGGGLSQAIGNDTRLGKTSEDMRAIRLVSMIGVCSRMISDRGTLS